MEWQPIESAPKDGSYIIAGLFGRSRELAWVTHSYWSTAADRAEDDGLTRAQADDFETGWQVEHDGVCAPTHWMPLPTPPANQDEA